MLIEYANESQAIARNSTMMFLAGPTPRDANTASWRPRALSLLVKSSFDGAVFVPEPRDGVWATDYHDQVAWEYDRLSACTDSENGCIAVWLPRELETLPGFTTNVEFGLFVNTGKLIYGRPNNAPKTRYLDWVYQRITGRQPSVSLERLIDETVKFRELHGEQQSL